MRLQRYMGIDYGEKRVGLALADDEKMLAIPHRVFKMSEDLAADLEHLAAIVKGEADVVILGLPLTTEGTEGPMAKTVREFAQEIQFRTDLPVHFQDERFSSRENVGLLTGIPKEQRLLVQDALAAAGILQTWLDRKKALQARASRESVEHKE